MSNHTCSDRPLPKCKISIVVTATIFTLFKANIRRPRHLFCCGGRRPPPSYIGLNRINIGAVTTVLALSVMVGLSMCDWTLGSSPFGLHVPLPFGPCAIARKGGSARLYIPSYTFIYSQIPLYTFIYPHIPQNTKYEKYEGQHETQKLS